VGHVSSVTYFSNLLEDKDRRLKIKLTLSLILRVNLRLRGYSIWSASSIAPHIKEELTTTRGMSTSQSRCSQGVLGGHHQDEVRENSKMPLEVLWSAVLDNEELGGLSDPGPQDCAHSILLIG
jgi:hypothetical protein